MVLRLLLLLLVVMVLFALVVMGVDGNGRDGRHHSPCYWEHWDGLRRGEQHTGSRYEGTASPPGQNFAAGGDFTFNFGRARLSGSKSETLTLNFSIYLNFKNFLKQYESIYYVQPPPTESYRCLIFR